MKLIEAELEKTVIEKIRYRLETYGGIDIIGAWSVVGEANNKGEEKLDDKNAIISVKVLPRLYETPTIPHAEFQVQVNLVVRSEVDFGGKNYLDITAELSDIFQQWQNDFCLLNELNIPNQFEITGFQLSGGDCGIDRDNCVWQFSQGFSIFGIIQNLSIWDGSLTGCETTTND